MTQKVQFNYNFINVIITYFKGYLLDKKPNMRPKKWYCWSRAHNSFEFIVSYLLKDETTCPIIGLWK
jgi:hypothetical protein